MARRWNRNMGAKSRDERSSIGDSHVDAAITAIDKTCQRAMTTMLHYQPSLNATINMLFDPDIIQRSIAARGIINPRSERITYDLADDMEFGMDYSDNTNVVAIEASWMTPQQPAVQPLLMFIEEARVIYQQYEEVKAVLKWLNRNATPGAIRYYFPTALQLCPTSTSFKDLQAVPSRYDIPFGIGRWMQVLKDAAATVAGSLMMPADVQPRQRDCMWLTFTRRSTRHPDTGEGLYTTDAITFTL